ncbi:hypothetical protein CB1_000568050 [Camelus ferus]|nr:hypothetical protein CB1_000568050 [Camelus ferus]
MAPPRRVRAWERLQKVPSSRLCRIQSSDQNPPPLFPWVNSAACGSLEVLKEGHVGYERTGTLEGTDVKPQCGSCSLSAPQQGQRGDQTGKTLPLRSSH